MLSFFRHLIFDFRTTKILYPKHTIRVHYNIKSQLILKIPLKLRTACGKEKSETQIEFLLLIQEIQQEVNYGVF